MAVSQKNRTQDLGALHIACCWSFHARLITCERTMHESAGMLGLESSLV